MNADVNNVLSSFDIDQQVNDKSSDHMNHEKPSMDNDENSEKEHQESNASIFPSFKRKAGNRQ